MNMDEKQGMYDTNCEKFQENIQVPQKYCIIFSPELLFEGGCATENSERPDFIERHEDIEDAR